MKQPDPKEGLMTYPPALFSYAVSPDTVPYTQDDKSPSIVTLMVAVNNSTGKFQPCTQIVFSLPVGVGGGDLTNAPKLSPAPALGVPWTITSDGQGNLTALPKPPVTGLDAGASIAFLIPGLTINNRPGLAEITVYEQTDQMRTHPVGVNKTPPGLAITSFNANPVQIVPGGSTTLAWTTTGAQSCTLSWEGNFQTVPTNGQLGVSPPLTTMYTLTATGSGAPTSQTIWVYVPQPQILSFGAAPTKVPMGGPTTLTWKVVNADTATIEGDPVSVPTGTRPEYPQDTVKYQLSATGFGSTVSMDAPRVQVMPVVIDDFTATPSYIPPGGTLPVTLKWDTEWATGCAIAPSVGDVPLNGTATSTPASTTTYSLQTQGKGAPSKSASVTLCPAVKSLELIADPVGNQITLAWQTVGGTVELLSPDPSPPLPASGATPFQWPWPNSVTLVVTGLGLQVVTMIGLPDGLAGASLDLTAKCDYGVNATGASGTFAWTSSGATVNGQIAAAQKYPVTGASGQQAIDYGSGQGQELWVLFLQIGGPPGKALAWVVQAPKPAQ